MHKTLGAFIKVRQGMIVESHIQPGMFHFNLMTLSRSLSCVEAGPGYLMVDMLGLFSQVWKLKDVSAQYTPF